MTADTPPSVCDAVGNAGPLPVVNWNGKAWAVGRPTPATLAFLEVELAAAAYRRVLAMKRSVTAVEFAEMKAAVLADIGDNKFAFNQPRFWGSMSGPDGTAILLWASLTVRHPEATLADAKRMLREAADEVDLAMAITTPQVFAVGVDSLDLPPDQQAAILHAILTEWVRAREEMKPATPAATHSSTSTPPSATTPA